KGLERSLRGHRVQDAVNRFVTSNSEDGGADDLVALLVDHDFHEALGLAFLQRTGDARHGPAANADLVIFRARFGFGHANPPQWRIDEQAVAGNSIAEAARAAVQQILGDNLEVVV